MPAPVDQPHRPTALRAPGWAAGWRAEAAELLDAPGHDPDELRDNLRDIRTVNRLAGGVRVVLHHLPDLLATVPHDRPTTILDLATGSGDVPRAVVRWAREVGRPVELIASDVAEDVLATARETLGHLPEVRFARYDARAVPLPDGAVDVVLCSLALHHFGPDDAARLLGEMDRLGRVGFILNDIRRDRVGHAAAWLASRVATRNRLTRHDMPLSVRRAYTPDELRDLLAEAGVAEAVVTRHPLFRMAAVKRRAAPPPRHSEPPGAPWARHPSPRRCSESERDSSSRRNDGEADSRQPMARSAGRER